MERAITPRSKETRPWREARRALVAGVVIATAGAGPAVASAAAALDPEHAAWSRLLERHVSEGRVDYAALARVRPELDAYLRSLEAVDGTRLEALPSADQLAFWINAYNGYTVKLVLDHYPLRSIRSIGFLPGSAFRRKFIPLERAAGKTLSLDDIEHRILRERFREPRIHFAIVCASRSCPVLRREAYRGRDLDAQLDDAARTFLRDPSRNRYDHGSRTFLASRIFEWFRGDFEAAAATLPAYLARFLEDDVAEVVRRGDVRVDFLDYDWTLNER